MIQENDIKKLIVLKNVTKIYKLGRTDVWAMKDVSISIEKAEFLAVRGPSGSGKSTLMNIIGCLDRPSTGEYFLNGEPVDKLSDRQLARIRNHKIGFVFQSFNLLPRINTLRNTELPLLYAGVPAFQRKQISLKILKSVALENRIYHYPNELSGGERQRVAIARALVNSPSIILADEPTGNLDSESGKQIMSIFEKLNRDGITIILVTHEADIAKYARRTINLLDGKIFMKERRI